MEPVHQSGASATASYISNSCKLFAEPQISPAELSLRPLPLPPAPNRHEKTAVVAAGSARSLAPLFYAPPPAHSASLPVRALALLSRSGRGLALTAALELGETASSAAPR